MTLSGFLLLTAPGIGASGSADTEQPGSRGLTLLVTSGLAGKLVDGEQTLAGLLATIEKLAAEAERQGRTVAVIDAGTTLVPYAESRHDAGEAMIHALRQAGCRAWVPHPTDFTVGLGRLSQLASGLDFPVLWPLVSDDPAARRLLPSVVLELGGGLELELGVVYHRGYEQDLKAHGIEGLLPAGGQSSDDEAADRGQADTPASADRIGAAESGLDPAGRLRMAIVHSRGSGAGLRSRELTWGLVEAPAGLDLLYDPNLGADLALRNDRAEGPVYLFGRALHTADPWQVAEVRLELARRNGRWQIEEGRQLVHGVDPEAPVDRSLAEWLQGAFGEFRRAHRQPFGSAAPTDRNGLERFVLRAVREAAAAEVGIVNRGSLRPVDTRYFEEDPLRRETVMRILSYDQGLVVGELTGSELRRLAEQSSQRSDEEGSTRQGSLRFWGLDFEVSDPGLSTAEVSGFEVNGRRLVDTDRYRVVTTSFLAGGGEGYPILEEMEAETVLVGDLHRPAGEPAARSSESPDSPAEMRDDVVLPRLARAEVPFVQLEDEGLWRFGVKRLSLAFDGVDVDADEAYREVADSRAKSASSTKTQAALHLFADQEWSDLRWESSLRARFDLLDSGGGSAEQADDLRLETSVVFTGRTWLGGHPYAGYFLDTEIRVEEDSDGNEQERQLEQNLAFGITWSAPRWPRLRLGAVARARDDIEEAERLGVLAEADFLWRGGDGRLGWDGSARAEVLEDSDGRIERYDFELRLVVRIHGALHLTPAVNLYRYRDSRLPGAADYQRFTLGLTYAWIGKRQRGLFP
ncbi:MAG: 5'-nucleotidase C-terminal domain-containing protein [Holophagales bacterium]|nr:5'-nucleotidase C-terminal domain-containing protein [Holophagales bacterium]